MSEGPSSAREGGPAARTGMGTRLVRLANVDDSSAVPIYVGNTNRTDYTRDVNPTIGVLETAIADLEGAEAALATACGMSAVSQALLGVLSAGDRVICHRCHYLSTLWLMYGMLKRFGVEVHGVDMRDLAELERALAKPAQLVIIEAPANPNMDIVDIAEVSQLAHDAGAKVVMDATFLTPYVCRPISHGVDIVVHSATKYLSGHGDALCGLIVSDAKTIEQVKKGREVLGGVASPFNAFLVLRGLKTLHLRMEAHSSNAMRLASFLEQHPAVAEVRYPGLESFEGHAVARKQMNPFGGMLGFRTIGGLEGGRRVYEGVRLCKPWVSLGDVETLVGFCDGGDPPNGIPVGYLRVSVGLEDGSDIIEDFEQALERIMGPCRK